VGNGDAETPEDADCFGFAVGEAKIEVLDCFLYFAEQL